MQKVGLKILIAGCPPKDRGRIEGVVKGAFAELSESDPWNVSLVKLGDKWSISLHGPEPRFEGLSLTASEENLHATILGVLNPSVSEPASAPAPENQATTPAPAGAEPDSDNCDRHRCPSCRRPFMVIYMAQPDEPVTKAPVACPHCWQMTQVPIAEGAAATEEYRAEAIQA